MIFFKTQTFLKIQLILGNLQFFRNSALLGKNRTFFGSVNSLITTIFLKLQTEFENTIIFSKHANIFQIVNICYDTQFFGFFLKNRNNFGKRLRKFNFQVISKICNIS